MEQRDRLIKLAARILMTPTPPSTYIGDHECVPKNVPVKWWRWMYGRLVASENERKRWAINLSLWRPFGLRFFWRNRAILDRIIYEVI